MTQVSIRDVLRALPARTLGLVESIAEAAERRDQSVYLVGGPVRDYLLGRDVRDVDLLIESDVEGIAESLAREAAPDDTRIVAHERFGTVAIEWGDTSVDLAVARCESYARPGALPKVEPAPLSDDLARRDFAVNAMALPLCGPSVARSGRVAVVDPHEGLADLRERRLRILHPRSFHDDPTRALRAARLAPRLGFSLSRGSRPALRDALRDGAFGAVSGDRLRREFEKLFGDAVLGLMPGDALRLLRSWHVLTALEPGLDLLRGSQAALRRLGKAVAAPPWPPPRWRPLGAGLAVWLAALSPSLRRRTVGRLSLRGELANRVIAFPKERDARIKSLASARGRGAVDAILSDISEESLFALYASAPPPIARRIVRWAAEDRGRRLSLSGSDLVELGLSGPAVGRALGRIREATLDGEVANREEAMALARELSRRSRSRQRAKPTTPSKGRGRTAL
jgi:tRNA nucleotidyltransferase (CCA-adding enzyme)